MSTAAYRARVRKPLLHGELPHHQEQSVFDPCVHIFLNQAVVVNTPPTPTPSACPEPCFTPACEDWKPLRCAG